MSKVRIFVWMPLDHPIWIRCVRKIPAFMYYNSKTLVLVKKKNLVLIQENSIESSIHDYLPYIPETNGLCSTTLAYPKWLYICLKINIYITCCIMLFFQNLLLPSIMTYYCVTVTDVWWWVMPIPNLGFQNKNKWKRK